MTKKEGLYYLPGQIEINWNDNKEASVFWHRMITEHEVSGLKSLGCQVEICSNWIIVSQNPRSTSSIAYFNRIIDIKASEDELKNLIETKRRCSPQTSFVINPFTLPRNAESILADYGASNVLSSMVIGKELIKVEPLPDTQFVVCPITPESSLENKERLFDLFSNFFLKNGESENDARRRLTHNMRNGAHFLALNKGEPVAMAGAAIYGEVASGYTGIVKDEYRTTNILDRLGLELANSLIKGGVKFVYMKSRNRGLIGYARRYYGFKSLYGERVYEI